MAIGVWLVGARGSVACTVSAGAAAVAAGVAETTGLVTELPALAGAALPAMGELVIGGHDVIEVPLRKRAEDLAHGGVLPTAALAAVNDDLDRVDARIRPGVTSDQDERLADTLARLRADLDEFRAANDLESVVVINVASTEAQVAPHPAQRSLDDLRRAIDRDQRVLPPSSCYAHAALSAGYGYIDFTPSTGSRLPALHELATTTGAVHAGRDGKTGETLLKSALAPMFADRHLRVRSWAATNLLGGGDGLALTDPGALAAKVSSKAATLGAILSDEPDAPVHIHYLEDLGEWKTSWDHISFEGFLGTRMRLQFTWEGCDSALAAPLVIDLARLAGAAQRHGARGPLPELAFFFKDPDGTTEHRLSRQFDRLCHWATTLPSRP
jgi:myo-inositol-1-phosphate synthase